MAAPGKQLQPIIIKRVKKAGHTAHGGAWKIAYADFVTAMMAFFLLMWLLGSTAGGDLQGIAQYFQNPMKVALLGGSGSGNSNSPINGGGADLARSNGQVKSGDNASTKRYDDNDGEAARRERERIERLRAQIQTLITADPRLKEFQSQIRLDVSSDGLRIEIVDDQSRPMFDLGSALVKPHMRDILRSIGSSLSGVENRVSLEGHTDAAPYGNGERGYSNWELSADRANASRRELVAAGMPDDKLVRVIGLASSSLLNDKDPRDPVNRRISIMVMTREAEKRLLSPPESVRSGTLNPVLAPAPPQPVRP